MLIPKRPRALRPAWSWGDTATDRPQLGRCGLLTRKAYRQLHIATANQALVHIDGIWCRNRVTDGFRSPVERSEVVQRVDQMWTCQDIRGGKRQAPISGTQKRCETHLSGCTDVGTPFGCRESTEAIIPARAPSGSISSRTTRLLFESETLCVGQRCSRGLSRASVHGHQIRQWRNLWTRPVGGIETLACDRA